MVYYNEFDPFAAEWLRQLIKKEMIPFGRVDERSINEVSPEDLAGHTQCHFFAGIGGWALALKQAKWGNSPIWTGSCPCQPFSLSGKQEGVRDERHLWPAFYNLIKKCKPPVVLGEQVAASIGKNWLDLVFTDLEREEYACGAVVLGAHSAAGPHIRQRLYWVGNREHGRSLPHQRSQGDGRPIREPGPHGDCGLSHTTSSGPQGTAGKSLREQTKDKFYEKKDNREEEQTICRPSNSCPVGRGNIGTIPDGKGFWKGWEWLPFRDSKRRPVEPGTFPLAHGISKRVGRLRGYGNAICVPTAVEFVKACKGLRIK